MWNGAGNSSILSVKVGVHQGSVLSLLLTFALFMDMVLKRKKGRNTV
jgi:hypothetical protein